MVNDTDEMTKIDKIQQDTLTKNIILHVFNTEEYAGAVTAKIGLYVESDLTMYFQENL